ncbi:methyltransferase/methylase [Streptomyces inusitatus]|uniref:Methyltransferase/methylase n=1 Tax=Streptomyces inusitatus TaxID=68221 RepID=A0A918QK24_9ACTN|nr:methyltransferase [Streptomyces inusitatus]GGZ50471.1 methyltransferase/methylase [Streptomyces inusitatus]
MTSTVSPTPLMDLTLGVYAFKALALSTELEVFTELSGGRSITLEGFADRHGIHVRPAELLLTGCVSLGLLQLDDEGQYGNTPLSEEYLVKGKPRYFGGWVTLVDKHEYPAYLKMEDSLRGNHPSTWDVENQKSLFQPDDPIVKEHFWDAMHSLSAYTAGQLAQSIDFSKIGKLLDVGGGGAAYDIELCRRHPHLRTTVFDLPFVCELTRPRVVAAGLADRIDFASGDFFEVGGVPEGYDAILLSNILHDWGIEDARKILRACAEALPSGGVLLITEAFVDDDKRGPVPAAMMSLNMLVETWGRNYTAAEYAEWMAEFGLKSEGITPFDGQGANGVLVARKP